MTTAVLSALPEEQQGLAALLEAPRTQCHAGRKFVTGRLHSASVVLALSGIGKVAAATTATLLAERFGVGRIVFTGVAGGLAARVRVGDIVIADEFLQHDIDASPLFPRHEVPLYGRSRFPADAALSKLLREAAAHWCGSVQQVLDADVIEKFALDDTRTHGGLLIAGDRFVSTAGESSALRVALPDALAVDMESAAVAQVCFDYDLPFAAMRTISDRADDLAHVDFPAFLAQVASRYACSVIDELCKLLSKK